MAEACGDGGGLQLVDGGAAADDDLAIASHLHSLQVLILHACIQQRVLELANRVSRCMHVKHIYAMLHLSTCKIVSGSKLPTRQLSTKINITATLILRTVCACVDTTTG